MELHTWQTPDGVFILSVSGELDVFDVPPLRDELTSLFDAGHDHIVVNLERVTFLDSTGVGVLLSAIKRATATGGTMRLVVGSERIRRTLRILSVDQLVRIYHTLDAALEPESPHGD